MTVGDIDYDKEFGSPSVHRTWRTRGISMGDDVWREDVKELWKVLTAGGVPL
jgi:hypothetical protein